jgi:hypothetical protein
MCQLLGLGGGADIVKAKEFRSQFSAIRGAIFTGSTCEEPNHKEKLEDGHIQM